MSAETLQQHADFIRRLARSLIRDEHEADDAVQDAFVSALSNPPREEGIGPWFRTVIRRKAAQARRGAARRNAREAFVARPEHEGGVDPAWLRERDEIVARVAEAVVSLAEPYRAVIHLRFYEGLAPREIARRLGVPVETVRTRQKRALAELRTTLDGSCAGGRAAWCAALLPVASAAPKITVSLSSLLRGASAMSSTTKVGTVCAVLALGAAFAWFGREERRVLTTAPVSPEVEAASEAAPALVAAGGNVEASRAPAAGAEAVADEESTQESSELASRPAFPPRPLGTVGALDLSVRWADGRPATDVNVRLMPWGADDAFLHERTLRTDASGLARVDQLAPGTLGLYVDRCPGGTVEIFAGRVTTHDLEIPDGIVVRGRVYDPAGEPVAGATVCLSAHGNATSGFPVAETGHDGRYELRAVQDQRYLSARARGFAPSDQVYANAADGSSIEIDLVLRGSGGVLEGVVRSQDGVPLFGARVVVTGDVPPGWQGGVEDGRRRRDRPLPFELRTDLEGRFAVEELGAGSATVEVRAEGWAPFSGRVNIARGGREELDISLSPGSVLEGRVSHADGSPAAGAIVSRGRYGQFTSQRVRAGADGRYRIEGMSPGVCELRATKTDRGETATRISIDEGTTARWDAVLVEGDRVEGYVVDERGEPLAGWVIGVTNGRGLWSQSGFTDAEGAFVVADVEPTSTALFVGPPDAFATGPALVLPEAIPATEIVRIVVPDEARHTASARLRVLVGDEPAPSDAAVVVRSRQPYSYRELFPDDKGDISIERLRPALYVVEAGAPDCARGHMTFGISAREELDLGVMRLDGGGRARVVVTGEPASEALQARVIDANGHTIERFDIEGGVGESGRLAAGPLRVLFMGRRVAAEIIEGVIVEGETIELRAHLRRGTGRWITAATDDGSLFPNASTLSVHDGAGALVWRSEGPGGDLGTETRMFLPGLEIGNYRIEVETSDGRSGDARFSIATLEATDESVATVVVGD